MKTKPSAETTAIRNDFAGVAKPRAVIFDWDNTLVETWPVIHAALNATLVKMGHDSWSEAETHQRVRKSLRDSFPELFGDQWEFARDFFYEKFASLHLTHLQVMPGAEDMLKAIKAKDVPMAVLSNKTGKYLRAEVAHLKWGSYFFGLVGATDALEDKPSPKSVAHLLDPTEIPLGPEVWMVGDTAIDMECAHKAGLRAVAIRPKTSGDLEFSNHIPDFWFISCDEFKSAWNKID